MALATPTVHDFIKQIRDAVKYAKIERDVNDQSILDHLRPSTFVLLPDQDTRRVDQDAFGRVYNDRDAAFFYSRDWEIEGKDKFTWSPPLVVMMEKTSRAEGLFNGTNHTRFTKEYYEFELWVVDQYKEQCCVDKTGTNADQRTPDEVRYDCDKILRNIIGFLGRVCYAKLGYGGVQEYGWCNEDLGRKMVAEGVIESFEVQSRETDIFRVKLDKMNAVNSKRYIDGFGERKLWGRAIDITFVEEACVESAEPTLTKKQVQEYYRRLCCSD